MASSQLLNGILILIGGVIMFFAILRTRQILPLLQQQGRTNRDWKILFALSLFFLSGYGLVLYLVVADRLDILVSSFCVILLVGGWYALLASRTGALTIESLLNTSVSRDYLDNVVTSMREALIVVDMDGRIQTVNQAACQLLDYSETELVNTPIEKICQVGSHEVQALAEQGSVRNMERIYRAKDGREIPVLMSCSAMHDDSDSALGVVCIAQDIAEQKQTAETLRESEKRYLDIIESSHDMVQSIFPDGHFEFVNRAWLTTLEYTQDELPNLTLFDVSTSGHA